MLYSVVQSFPRWLSYILVNVTFTRLLRGYMTDYWWDYTKTSHSYIQWWSLLFATSIFVGSALDATVWNHKKVFGITSIRKTLWDCLVRKVLNEWFLNNVSKSWLLCNCAISLFLMVRDVRIIFFSRVFLKSKPYSPCIVYKLNFFQYVFWRVSSVLASHLRMTPICDFCGMSMDSHPHIPLHT
jgi:hypothetical protein